MHIPGLDEPAMYIDLDVIGAPSGMRYGNVSIRSGDQFADSSCGDRYQEKILW